MKLDTNKILGNKKNPIQTQFEFLRDHYTLENSIEYLQFVRNHTSDVILENSAYIYSEPRSGADFLLTVLKTNDLTMEDLQVQKEGLGNFINKCKSNGYSNEDHLKTLLECHDYINSELSKKSTPQYLKESTIYQLHLDFLPKPTLVTESVSDDMDRIIHNINYEPEVADKYRKMVSKIRTWKAGMAAINFVPMVVKNTALLVGLTVLISGAVITLMVSLPLLIVAKMIQDKVNIKYINSYVAVLDKQIHTVEDVAATSDSKKKTMLEKYIKSLKEAKKKLLKYKGLVIKSKAAIKENLGDMAPVITYEEDESLEELEGKDAEDDDNDKDDELPDLDLLSQDLADDIFDTLDCEDLDFDDLFRDDLDEDDDEDEDFDNDIDDPDAVAHDFSIKFIDIIFSDEDDMSLESFNELMKLAYNYTALTEGISDTVRRAANAIEDKARKDVHNIRKTMEKGRHVAVAVKRIPSHLENLINTTLDAVKKMDKDERRKRIIEGTWRVKLFKLIRNGILFGAAWAVSPALAAIGLIAGVGIDKMLDDKVRREIVHELETELNICKEKIEDSRSDQEKDKKYQLIRIKDKLEDEIARIKYRLDVKH